MKNYILIILTFLSINFSFSQEELKEVTKEDSLRFETEIKKAVDSLKISLSSEDYLNEADKEITIKFKIDTFIVEKRLELYINQDYSDYGMNVANTQMLTDYEKLLNKYYKLLLASLEKEDKETLKITQRNWVKYRESEHNLNDLISQDKYSGGGTIQNLFVISREIEITQQRVVEIYDYIGRINLNKM